MAYGDVQLAAILDTFPTTIAAGAAQVFDCRGRAGLAVLAGTGATVTINRVDSPKATADTAGAENTVTPPAANAAKFIPADWSFYRVATTGGSVRVAVV